MSVLVWNDSRGPVPEETGRCRRCTPPRQRGVILVNVGTPEGPDIPSVRSFLAEFLSDPMVVRLPAGLGWLQGAFGRLIARFQAPRSARKYRTIWTERGSPLKAIMEDQASALELALPRGWRVFVGMRYGRPRIAEVLAEIQAAGIGELVIVPMYPQFSRTTTGTVIRETYRALKRAGQDLNVATRTTWYDDVGYVNAQAQLIADCVASNALSPENTYLLFSAHGLPVSYVTDGDPYARHVQRTLELVVARLGWPADRMGLAYQSRLGPAEWLRPDAAESLAELARAGEKKVLVCPISFSVDCLETLEEIDIRYRADFEAHGGKLYLCPALNTYEPFIAALKNLVLRGPRPQTSHSERATPLLAPKPAPRPAEQALGSLVMIGVSLQNRLGPGRGPRLGYSEPGPFCCVKKPHDEVYTLLQALRSQEGLREAFVWNTCHRFELYGWLEKADAPAGGCVVARIRKRLFDPDPEGLVINVLIGHQAWHHLVRTVAGLNSGLPGDRDVVEQLQTAHRLAEASGTAGPRSRRLVNEAVALAEEMRAQTAWGRLDPGYCFASLSRICDLSGLCPAVCRHLVIGGSTTSCSILHTLHERFGVDRRQMTLVYRSHGGGRIKLLRKAIGNGARLRTHSYTEQAVLRAVADADVVFFGIDRDTPVLDAGDLRGLRDFAHRPLTVIDFNTFGSTSGLETLDGVNVWTAARLEDEVAAYAETMCAARPFAEAVHEVEDWIARREPKPAAMSLDLPCIVEGRDRSGHPDCIGCRLAVQEVIAEVNAR